MQREKNRKIKKEHLSTRIIGKEVVNRQLEKEKNKMEQKYLNKGY